MRGTSLHTKLFLCTGGIIVALITGILFLLDLTIKRATLAVLDSELRLAESVVSDHFDKKLYSQYLISNVIGESPVIKSVLSIPNVDHATVFYSLQEFGALLENDWLSVTDSDGKVLSHSDARYAVGADLSARPDVAGALSGRTNTRHPPEGR